MNPLRSLLAILPAMNPGESRRFSDPIPAGMRIYMNVEVAGTYHRLAASSQFCLSRNPALAMRHESWNKHDRNAMAVYGLSDGLLGRRRKHIGYIPGDEAETLSLLRQACGIELLPRLRRVWLSEDGRTPIISLDLLGPKEHYQAFKEIIS